MHCGAPAEEGCSLLCELAQQAAVNILERFQLGDVDVFVDFVNRSIRRTQFQNLRTNLCDEAAIAGAACRGKLRFESGLFADRLLDAADKRTGCCEKGEAADDPLEGVFESMPIKNASQALLKGLGCGLG